MGKHKSDPQRCHISEIQSDRLSSAQGCAQRHGCHTVLKGYQTISTAPSGRAVINSTGNPGMATGGSGDILAGMMGRFVATWKTFRAEETRLLDHIAAAVYLHGLAGDLAAAELGMECMVATDLVKYLPAAFERVATG